MNIQRYKELLDLAKTFHGAQSDYTGRPNWLHCSRVFEICMTVLTTYGHNTLNTFKTDKYDGLIITALFHDVIEDVSDGRQLLKDNLSKDEFLMSIARIDELSKAKGVDYQTYIDTIVKSEDWVVILVKFADLVEHVERLPFIEDDTVQNRLAQKYIQPLKKLRLRAKIMLDTKSDQHFHIY